MVNVAEMWKQMIVIFIDDGSIQIRLDIKTIEMLVREIFENLVTVPAEDDDVR